MNISVEQVKGRVPVALLRLQGDLDGSNYRDVIARARELHQSGTRHLVVDLSETPYMSSAGLVALHTIAQLFRGAETPDPETEGWRAIRAMGESQTVGAQPFVKLLSPRPKVVGVIEQTGLLPFFEIYTEQAAAVASF